ncbi:YccF domain-containing protein [Carboxylicivirga sp. N1Y90]|uniref:YccF domain-containing protein n=1 Tax=Carboxylicivirga fragile TaxID=3417571 RepID=UPI003D347BF1|nr:YccF domain-containing protein [Marinilabiliaceae bacterium N1Y90]
MSFIGNLIWLIFGGLIIALEYFVCSLLLIVTIIGIPFGLQTLKLGVLALWPFGSEARYEPQASGCLSTFMNVLWLIFGGFIIALTHVFWGIVLAITIIGIPFARQHFKLAGVALTPFGRTIV